MPTSHAGTRPIKYTPTWSTNQFLIHFLTCSVDLVGAFGPDLVTVYVVVVARLQHCFILIEDVVERMLQMNRYFSIFFHLVSSGRA